MKIRYLLLGLIPILVISLAFSLFANIPGQINSDGIKYTGVACRQVIRADGTVEPQECVHNIVTTAGKNAIKDYVGLSNAAKANFSTLAVANCSLGQAVGDTDLCGGERWTTCSVTIAGPDTGFPNSQGTGNWSTSHQWTSSCDTVYVNATGVYNSTAPGTMLAEANWTPVTTLMNGDKLNVTYYIWIT